MRPARPTGWHRRRPRPPWRGRRRSPARAQPPAASWRATGPGAARFPGSRSCAARVRRTPHRRPAPAGSRAYSAMPTRSATLAATSSRSAAASPAARRKSPDHRVTWVRASSSCTFTNVSFSNVLHRTVQHQAHPELRRDLRIGGGALQAATSVRGSASTWFALSARLISSATQPAR